MSWYVLYTKPNCEKKTTKFLKSIKINVFCPLQKGKIKNGKKKSRDKALFPSYIFVKIRAKDRNLVFQAPWVKNYVFWLNKPVTVSDEEINIIKRWTENDKIIKIELDNSEPGDKMLISKGVFKGKEVIVQRIQKNNVRLFMPSMKCYVIAESDKLFEI